MFKKTNPNAELGLFSTAELFMTEREGKNYSDPHAWHNEFYRNVTCNIDEDIFKPLFVAGNMGAPTRMIRVLVAMRILKEGHGCSDNQLYENMRYNLLWRKAVGLASLSEACPSIDSYYMFFKRVCEYEASNGVNLYKEVFKSITSAQARCYKVSGKTVRMDSKLIGSNIAWFSRFEIIHTTYVKSVTREDAQRIREQLYRELALEFLEQKASNIVYYSSDEELGKSLLNLGIIIGHVLSTCAPSEKALLRRVYDEQYEVDGEGNIRLRDKAMISSRSVQNPNDPDATYRSKGKQKIKGYSTNITEICDEVGKPSLITDVQVKDATAADNSYLQDAVKETETVCGNSVCKIHADGAYQSPENRRFAETHNGDGVEFVANGLQGKPSRYDLNVDGEGKLEVLDRNTSETREATKVRDGVWKLEVTNKLGAKVMRYFRTTDVERCETRKKLENFSWDERKKRNNVEATIFQYCFTSRNNKTRYRGKIKTELQALARCAWINMRRLFIYDTNLELQNA